MKKKYIFLILIVGVFAYYKLMYPDYTYRYRMTVEIDTPDGVKSGSSVIEVTTSQWPEWLRNAFGGNTSSTTVKGEAVFIDLGNEKNAVALLARGKYAQRGDLGLLAPRAFIQKDLQRIRSSEFAKKLTKITGESRKLEGHLTPTIVTFNDVNNPESIRLIYSTDFYSTNNPKQAIIDKVSSILGKGYTFKSAMIELTNDSLTDTLPYHLPWANDMAECRKAWKKISSNPPKGKRFHFTYMCKFSGQF